MTDDFHTSRNLVTQNESNLLTLGKVYLCGGSEIANNDLGVKVSNCLLAIDKDKSTIVHDNTQKVQV